MIGGTFQIRNGVAGLRIRIVGEHEFPWHLRQDVTGGAARILDVCAGPATTLGPNAAPCPVENHCYRPACGSLIERISTRNWTGSLSIISTPATPPPIPEAVERSRADRPQSRLQSATAPRPWAQSSLGLLARRPPPLPTDRNSGVALPLPWRKPVLRPGFLRTGGPRRGSGGARGPSREASRATRSTAARGGRHRMVSRLGGRRTKGLRCGPAGSP
jgi:hypothetical protein